LAGEIQRGHSVGAYLIPKVVSDRNRQRGEAAQSEGTKPHMDRRLTWHLTISQQNVAKRLFVENYRRSCSLIPAVRLMISRRKQALTIERRRNRRWSRNWERMRKAG